MEEPKAVLLRRIRFADDSDIPEIIRLCNESTRANFRISEPSDVLHLISNNIMSIVQLDSEDEVIGFLSVKDYPLQPSVMPGEWEDFLWKTYKAVELNSRNTMFIHMFCWKNVSGCRKIVDNLMKSVFMHDPYISYIAIVKYFPQYQSLLPGNTSAEVSFRRVQALVKGVSPENLPSLWIADRSEVSPRLRIRRAVEEDNDDLIPILDGYSPRLKQLYGEYYISELVAYPETRVLLVCEHKEMAVGVMCLNTEINYEALEQCYDLAPFAGLKHSTPTSYLGSMGIPRNEEPTPDITESRMTMASHSRLFDESTHELHRVSWGDISDSGEEIDSYDWFFEDDIDYDIVNIDENLLKVPRQLSCIGLYNDLDFYKLLKKLNDPLYGSVEKAQVKMIPKAATTSASNYGAGSSATLPYNETTRYNGTPNAFLLELFAMSPNYDERYGFDILEVAYEMFPDRQYCILSLPSDHPPFPLLEHFTLVSSFNIKRRFLNESLYVAHVNSIRGALRVRPGEEHDLHHLPTLMDRTWQRRQLVMELFQASLLGSISKVTSYVLLSENQPVGVVMIGPQETGEIYRAQFDIAPEPIRIGTDAFILGASISPLFEPHYRWFLREILRLSRYTALFWSFQTVSIRPTGYQSVRLTPLANQMVPMQTYTPLANITGFSYLDMFSAKGREPFTFWHIDRPLTSLPKVDINNNIVVVGSSATGLSFIEAMVMGPTSRYLNFTNVTLVSECGYSALFECSKAAVTCVPRTNRFTYSAMKRIPMVFYVDVVPGSMVTINRQKKYITLKNGNIVNYDTLVLTCGLQYQHPDYLKESETDQELGDDQCRHKAMDDPKYQPARVNLPPELPYNMMIINGVHDANVSLKRITTMIADSACTRKTCSNENVILVYGNSLDVYSCMAALLELKIDPTHIVFVEPSNEDESPRVNCFNDEKIDDRVQETIEKLGIQVYRNYNLDKWTVYSNRVKSVSLISTYKYIEIKCFAFFYFGKKVIDINSFKAMNECGLVYDGGLVVGADFETNDPHIYAAGTCTRYSRQLYADKYIHKYYYSEDVGKALASRFLLNLDPFIMMKDNHYCSRLKLPGYSYSLLRWKPIPRFESPLYVYAVLPGPLYYLRLRKPGPDIPMEVALSLPGQGHMIETDNNENFFRMKFNALHILEGATCLSKSEFQPEFYIQLYGKHESFFNNLFIRHEMNLVKDLNEYITQPWIAALYRSTFTAVIKDIYKQDVGTIYDVARAHSITDIQVRHSDPNLASAPCPVPILSPENAHYLGTLPEIIRKFISENYFNKFFVFNSQIEEFPPDCGQSVQVRAETAAYWKTVAGNRIVMSHLSKYLHDYAVTNPQYAKPQPELTYMCRL